MDPPQPPLLEIVDPILVRQKLKMFNEVFVKDPIIYVPVQPVKVELSHFHFAAISRHLDPPQPPPIQLEDNLSQTVSFRKKVFLHESPEDLMSVFCVHPSALELGAKTEKSDAIISFAKSWMSPPQAPAMHLDDDFSLAFFREKQFNINKFLKSQIILTFVPPAVTSRHQASQHKHKNENVEMYHNFSLESPQSPPLDIQDNIQKPASKIKNIHEPESLKALLLILQQQHSLYEEPAKNECHRCSLLKLDPPQPPPQHLEDNIQKPVFKIRTFQDSSLFYPQSPKILIKLPLESHRNPSLFRLSPPQPPLIEIEDSFCCLVPVLKRCLDRNKPIEQTIECMIPTQTPESVLFIHDFKIPSGDLQRPQVDVDDKVNILQNKAVKVLEENGNISLTCDVNVTVPWSPLITSCSRDLRRSPPSSPPTELADKPNSINFRQKNYYPEIICASVQFLQPQNYSDFLLRN